MSADPKVALTEGDLIKLEKLLQESTSPPWSAAINHPSHGALEYEVRSEKDELLAAMCNFRQAQARCDSRFIAAARNFVPALLATARRCAELEAENVRLREALGLFAHGCILLDNGETESPNPNPDCCKYCRARAALEAKP